MVDEAQRKCSRGLEGLGGELSFSKGKTNRTERIFDLVAYRVCVCVHVPVHVYLCVCVHRVNVEAKSQPQESFLRNNPPHKGMCISMCVCERLILVCVWVQECHRASKHIGGKEQRKGFRVLLPWGSRTQTQVVGLAR